MTFEPITAIQQLTKLLAMLSAIPKQIPGRNKRLFNDYIEPSYKLMREIHLDYLSIFQEGREHIRNTDRYFNEKDEQALSKHLSKIANIIWKRRKLYEGTRDLLQGESQAYVTLLDMPEMKRFFISVCDYFILDDDMGDLNIGSERDFFIKG